MNISSDKLWEMLEIGNIPLCLMKVAANDVSNSQIQSSKTQYLSSRLDQMYVLLRIPGGV
jgi:hypothetical protein